MPSKIKTDAWRRLSVAKKILALGIPLIVVVLSLVAFLFTPAHAAPGNVSSGLTMWLDAQDSSTLFTSNACTGAAVAGNDIGCWTDKSGNGNNVTNAAASKPTLLSNQQNGQPTLDFASDTLNAASTAGITSSGAYTKIAVVKVDSATSNNIISSASGSGHALWTNGSSANVVMYNGGTNFLTATSSIGTSNYYIIVARYGAPSSLTNVINVNGTQAASNSTTQTFTTANINIGSLNGAAFLDGKIGEAIVYNRALSDAEIDSIECYASSRWGISVTTGCNSITISQPVQYKTFQRNGSNKADIPISGTASGSPCTSIEASFNGGAYQTIDTTIVSNAYSGTLTTQNAGQGTLTVRCADNTSVSTTVNDVGIGDVYVVAGQSNAVGQGTNLQSFSHATLKATVYDQSNAWKIGNDKTDPESANGSAWPLLATKIMANTGYPVAFITTATGGTRLYGASGTWNKANGVSATDYNNMVSSVTASGVNSVKAVLWYQGEQDGNANITQSQYNSALDSLATNVATDLPGAPKIVAGSLGSQYYGDTATQLNSIRLAIQEAWGDNSSVLPGPVMSDIGPLADGTHLTTDVELQTFANRWWESLHDEFYGGTGDARGPRVSNAQISTDRTRVILTFTDTSLPITPSGSIGGITVKNNGTPVTINSITKVASDKIQATLASPANGTVTTDVASGSDAMGQTVVKDSSSTGLPMETAVGVATNQASLPVISSSGSFAESTDNDGSVTGSIVFTLADDTFVNPLTLNTHVSVTNVPTGLTAVITRNSATQASLTLTGNASTSGTANNVSNLTVTWLDGAFTTNSTASNVIGYQKTDGAITFRDYGVPGGVSSNLTMWLDAQYSASLFTNSTCTTAASAGNDIGCWADKSGNGNNVTQSGSAKPTLLASDANSHPSLDFLTDQLSTSGTGVITANGGYTKFVLFKVDTSGANNLISSGSGASHATYMNTSTTNLVLYNGGVNVVSATSAVTSSQYYVATFRYGAPSSLTNVIRVDGVQKASNSTSQSFTASTVQLGSSNGAANYLDGKIGEAIVYNRALNDSEVQNVECYMAARWGVTMSCGPTLTSLVKNTPSSANTNASTLTFRVTFSANVQNVDVSDFSVNGTGTTGATVSNVSAVSQSVYDVTVSGISTNNGTVNLDVQAGNNIQDTNGYALTSTTPTGADETYTLDHTAPSAPVISSPTAAAYLSSTTPTISGTGEDAATVTVKEGSTTLCTATVSSSSWSCTSSALSEASHTVFAYQTDAVGNQSASSSNRTFTVDATAPSAPVISSPTAAAYLSSTTPTISGTGEDAATVTVKEGSTTLCTATVSSSSWSCNSSALSQANHTIFAYQTDPASNQSVNSSNRTFTVDVTAPSAPVISSPSAASNTNDNTVSVSGTGAETNSTVTIKEGSTTLCTVVAVGSSWTCDTSALSDGVHTIFAYQTDLASNQSSNSASRTFSVDTINPSAPVISSPTAAAYLSSTTPTISGTGEDAATVTVKEGSTTLCTATVSSSSWSCTSSALSEASHTVFAYQTDAASNQGSNSGNITFTVDTTAPLAPTISSPVSSSFTSDSTPTISGTGEDSATVTVKEGSTTLCTATVSSSNWSCTANLLSQSSHTIFAYQIDLASNQSTNSSNRTFTVDTTAPLAPIILSPAGATITTDNTVSVTGAGAELGTTVYVKEGSSVLCSVIASGSSWTCDTSALSDGVHTIFAYQTDAASNQGSNSGNITFTVDTTAPSAPVITSPTASAYLSSITPTISGTGEDAATVTVKEGSTTLCTATVSSSSWSCASSVLSEGSHTIFAYQTDIATNQGNDSGNIIFNIDLTAPSSPTISAPTNATILTDITPTISGTGEDTATVTVKEGSTTLCTATVSSSNWSCMSSSLSGGAHTIFAYQTDLAGNQSSNSSNRNFSINTTIDTDNDGIPDSQENEGPNNGDANGDNIPDKDQPNVGVIANAETNQPNTIVSSGTNCTSVTDLSTSTEQGLARQDSNYQYPLGFLNFKLDCAQSGQTATITIIFDKLYDTQTWQARKFDATSNQFIPVQGTVNFTTVSVGLTQKTAVVYNLTDGADNDQDNTANSVIVDPVGVATEISTTQKLINTGIHAILPAAVGLGIIVIGSWQFIVANRKKEFIKHKQ